MASEVNFKNLISLDASGLHIASYSEILNHLIIRYKEAYGDDINVTNESADGIFLHNTALEINNILQHIQYIYSNLDINYATGESLDNLCALSSLYRKPATHSNAKVRISNLANTPATLSSVVAIDRSNNQWTYNAELTIAASSYVDINLTCETLGPVSAPVGSIYQIINLPNNVLISIEQLEDAVLGENEETDTDLRARKLRAASPDGTTVLDSLIGSLLQLSGVRDVLIYNNSDGSVTPAKDTTVIATHNIYVVMRYSDSVDDNLIGNTIYEKLTPGVMTTSHTTDASGTGKSIDYYPSVFGINNTQYSTKVYWKKAIAAAPAIVITFDNTLDMYFTESFAKDVIGKGLIDYLNNLTLSSDISPDEIKVKAYDLDPRYSGNWDFNVRTVTVNGNATTYTNADTFYNYSTLVYDDSGTYPTLTIS